MAKQSARYLGWFTKLPWNDFACLQELDCSHLNQKLTLKELEGKKTKRNYSSGMAVKWVTARSDDGAKISDEQVIFCVCQLENINLQIINYVTSTNARKNKGKWHTNVSIILSERIIF